MDSILNVSLSSDPDIWLEYLCSLFKNLVKGEGCQQFLILQGPTTPFQQGNPLHHLIVLWFSLFFTTDAICSIVVAFPHTKCTKLIGISGYSLCETNLGQPILLSKICDQWSVIFSYISLTDFQSTLINFSSFSSLPIAYRLIRYLRLDINEKNSNEFLQNIINNLKNLIKKKAITDEMLFSFSSLIITANDNQDLLTQILDVLYPLRDDKNLKSGILQIFSILLPKISKDIQKALSFFKNKLFSHCSDTRLTEQRLLLFHNYICGNQIDPRWFFWEWGTHPPVSRLLYVQWSSEPSNPSLFLDQFMTYFFPESNFSLCPDLFRDVLFHVVELNLNYFITKYINSFLSLKDNDPRIYVFLRIVPLVNKPEVKNQYVSKFNSLVFKRLLDSLGLLTARKHSHGLPIDVVEKEKSFMSDADLKISSFLEEWNITSFNEMHFSFNNQIEKDIPEVYFAQALESVIDIDSPEINDALMSTILSLCFRSNAKVSKTGLKMAHKFLSSETNGYSFLRHIIKLLSAPVATETFYISMNLLLDTDFTYIQIKPSERVNSKRNSFSESNDKTDSKTNENQHFPIHSPQISQSTPTSPRNISNHSNIPTQTNIQNIPVTPNSSSNSYTTNSIISNNSNNSNPINNSNGPNSINNSNDLVNTNALTSAAIAQDSNAQKKDLQSLEKIEIYKDMELYCLIGLASVFPEIRKVSFNLLAKLSELLDGQNCVYNIIKTNLKRIQEMVKKRIILTTLPKIPQPTPIITGDLNFDTVIISHYHGLWLYYISEIANLLVENKYGDERTRRLDAYFSMKALNQPALSGIAILWFSSFASSTKSSSTSLQVEALSHLFTTLQFNPNNQTPNSTVNPQLSSSNNMNTQMNENDLGSNFHFIRNPKDTYFKDRRTYIQRQNTGRVEKFRRPQSPNNNVSNNFHLMLTQNEEMLFDIIEHSHYSLFPIVIQYLSNIPARYYPRAIRSVRLFVQSPSIKSVRYILQPVINFVSVMRSYFISTGVNSSRIMFINPTQEVGLTMEPLHSTLINCCQMIKMSFSEPISEDILNLMQRQSLYTFLMNWANTTLADLLDLRLYASSALASLVHVGPILLDKLYFKKEELQLFTKLESEGTPALSLLVYFNPEKVLEVCIEQAFIQPPQISNIIFESMMMIFDGDEENITLLQNFAGPLVLLATLFQRKGHPRAGMFISALKDVLSINSRERLSKTSDESTKTNDTCSHDKQEKKTTSPSSSYSSDISNSKSFSNSQSEADLQKMTNNATPEEKSSENEKPDEISNNDDTNSKIEKTNVEKTKEISNDNSLNDERNTIYKSTENQNKITEETTSLFSHSSNGYSQNISINGAIIHTGHIKKYASKPTIQKLDQFDNSSLRHPTYNISNQSIRLNSRPIIYTKTIQQYNKKKNFHGPESFSNQWEIESSSDSEFCQTLEPSKPPPLLPITPTGFNELPKTSEQISFSRIQFVKSRHDNYFPSESFPIFNQLKNKTRHESFVNLTRYINITPFNRDPFDTETFAFAAESVLATAFHIMRIANSNPLHVLVDLCRPWVRMVRLLPKHSTCIPGTSKDQRRFSPYDFIEELMTVTESAPPAEFSEVASLWTELLTSPDHRELIPSLLGQWSRDGPNILLYLLQHDKSDGALLRLIGQHCTLACYLHITKNGKDFNSELWVVTVLATAFERNPTEIQKLNELIYPVIHFAFLFRSQESKLLNVFLTRYGIDIPGGPIPIQSALKIANQIATKVSKPCNWANEAMKWLIGSNNLEFASFSLALINMIYGMYKTPTNSYETPKDLHDLSLFHSQLYLDAVCFAVYTHFEKIISTGETNMNGINELVTYAIQYYTNVFQGNEVFCFNFASSLLDCCPILDCISSAAQLFLFSLSSPKTNTEAWSMIISIARPLLPKLETDEQSRKIIDLLIRTSKNQQLTVLAFPVRLCFVEHSFIGHDLNSYSMLSSVPLNIIQIASESALVNALSYYSEMCTTASTHLRESIFAASVAILHRTPAARVNAGGLFDSVIGSIPDCEAALELISLLKGSMDQNPGITLRDKSLEDVARKLSSLYEPPAQTSLITGCLSVSQVFSVSAIINKSHDRNEELPIRILPFATQDEMLESMKSQSKGQKYSRSSSFRKNSRNEPITPSSPIAQMEMMFNPLSVPNIVLETKLKPQSHDPFAAFVVSTNDFLDFPNVI